MKIIPDKEGCIFKRLENIVLKCGCRELIQKKSREAHNLKNKNKMFFQAVKKSFVDF